MSRKYKAAEKLLYTYPVNLMRWRECLLDYCRLKGENDCHAQNYTEIHGTGKGDPAGDYVNALMTIEQRMNELSARTRGITELRRELRRSSDEFDGVMLQVLELKYFDQMSMKDLALHLQMNERTLYRRREELVRRVIRDLGL